MYIRFQLHKTQILELDCQIQKLDPRFGFQNLESKILILKFHLKNQISDFIVRFKNLQFRFQ